jgi:hypothetical protein
MRIASLLLVPAVAACSGATRDVAIDTRGGAAPFFAMVRDGDGAWTAPTRTATGYRFAVRDDYTFVVACSAPTGFDAEFRDATAADGDAAVSCFPITAPPVQPTTYVSGRLVEAGDVSISGTSYVDVPADFSYATAIAPGPIDIVGSTATGVQVIRDVAPAPSPATTVLPTIDVAADGAALVPVTPTLGATAGSDEVLSTVYFFITAHGATYNTLTGATASLVPTSVMAPTDEQSLQSWLQGPDEQRGATARVTGAGTPVSAFALPPRLSPTWSSDIGGAVAELGPLPADYDAVTLQSSDEQGAHLQQVTATRAWLDLHGATALRFDTSAPGYDPAWVTDPNNPDGSSYAELDVTRVDPATAVSYLTSVWKPVSTD